MTEREELLRMLDLSLDETAGDELEIEEYDFDNDSSELEVSETVLRVDDWDRARGLELDKQHGLGSDLTAADFHSLVFHLDPTIAGKCISEGRQKFIETLMDSPEYKDLHQSTRQNLLASEMATVRFAREYATMLEKQNENLKADLVAGSPANPEEKGLPDGACLLAAAKALASAQQDVEELAAMEASLGGGCGLGMGSNNSVEVEKIRANFQRMRGSQRLREIFERAGAYRRAGKAIQQQKSKHGYDDMIGVELAGDVGKLVSSELALLGDEDLELDLLRRIVESQAMCRQYEGVEPQNKGPVVFVCDESGSMSGPKIANAKALALTMAYIAKQQKRFCVLVGFSGGRDGNALVIKPTGWGPNTQNDLVNWLEHFYGGGTTLDVPLVELPKNWERMGVPKGKTDIIIVTDAEVHAPKQMVDNFNTWKTEQQAKVITLVLGAQPGDLEKVSNEVHCIPSLTVDNDAAARCMGI